MKQRSKGFNGLLLRFFLAPTDDSDVDFHMSTSAKTEVYEAELISSEEVNPFAAPAASASERCVSAISEGIGRASQRQIDFANQSIVFGEITVAISMITFLVAMVEGGDQMAPVATVCTLIAWICFMRMVVACDDFDWVSMAMTLCFPIPVIGLLIFIARKQQVNRFLIWNGYKPGFIGASPDAEEIRLMNADPHYRPSAYYDRNGSRRRLQWSASNALVVAAIIVAIAAYAFALLQKS